MLQLRVIVQMTRPCLGSVLTLVMLAGCAAPLHSPGSGDKSGDPSHAQRWGFVEAEERDDLSTRGPTDLDLLGLTELGIDYTAEVVELHGLLDQRFVKAGDARIIEIRLGRLEPHEYEAINGRYGDPNDPEATVPYDPDVDYRLIDFLPRIVQATAGHHFLIDRLEGPEDEENEETVETILSGVCQHADLADAVTNTSGRARAPLPLQVPVDAAAAQQPRDNDREHTATGNPPRESQQRHRDNWSLSQLRRSHSFSRGAIASPRAHHPVLWKISAVPQCDSASCSASTQNG